VDNPLAAYDGAPGAACSTDSDCAGDEICVGGFCLAPSGDTTGPGGACQTDIDCSDDRICVGGQCVFPVTPDNPDDGCLSDADCKDDRVCVDAVCVYPYTPPDDATGGCTTDAECKDGRICVDGECVYPASDGAAGTGGSGGAGDAAGAGGTAGSAANDPGPVCGNGVVETGEQCDGADLSGQTCVGLGQGPGTLRCLQNCTFDLSLCESPGSSISDGGTADDGGATST
jgi:hypothetical protein